jgi:Ca2+/H+ antiporter
MDVMMIVAAVFFIVLMMPMYFDWLNDTDNHHRFLVGLSFLVVVFYGLYQTNFSSHNHSSSSSSEPDREKQMVIIGCSQQCNDTEGDIRQACFEACIQRNSQ